ncbi:hypothetical protein GCM10023084_76690 [Streptomyces lacrimifluminis]|uniref:Allantoin permease n=1 Tax=Streptomyces lacrimifluminis TaxID=1500077 RepID=A0A917P8Y8_9ACTN|nr:hypothetical protein GCM10012282_75110 [Streptomyces lacrimifluminis]
MPRSSLLAHILQGIFADRQSKLQEVPAGQGSASSGSAPVPEKREGLQRRWAGSPWRTAGTRARGTWGAGGGGQARDSDSPLHPQEQVHRSTRSSPPVHRTREAGGEAVNDILGFYSNCAIAWVVTVATDIGINKYLLKLSPLQPEFRRGMLYAVNPVGVVAFVAASGLSIAMYFHALGDTFQPYSPVAAAVIAFVLTPLMAIITKGKYYLRRTDDGINEPLLDGDGNPSALTYDCHVCRQEFERPDMTACLTHDATVCSLCLSTDKTADHVLSPAPTT